MKLNGASLFFLLSAAAMAQSGLVDNRERTMRCEDRSGDSARVQHCEVHEQTLASTSSLHVNAGPNGGITVKGWSQPGVLVRSKVEAWSRSASDAQTLFSAVQVHAVAGDVSATGPHTDGGSGWSVSYEVFVPHSTGLDLETRNGGLHIADVNGAMNLHAVNGGLHLTRLNGAVTAATVNGGVDVDLLGDHWDGRGLEASSTNGAIRVTVPQPYSGNFEASTVNGRIHSELAELSVPEGVAHARPQSMSGSIGSSGAVIHASTTNGNVVFARK
jgi:DUF4097 and DUF4098 domain-containing protein YvlB